MIYDVYRALGLDHTYWLTRLEADSAREALQEADRLFEDSEDGKLIVVEQRSQEGVSR